jgi:hypothetical protein
MVTAVGGADEDGARLPHSRHVTGRGVVTLKPAINRGEQVTVGQFEDAAVETHSGVRMAAVVGRAGKVDARQLKGDVDRALERMPVVAGCIKLAFALTRFFPGGDIGVEGDDRAVAKLQASALQI